MWVCAPSWVQYCTTVLQYCTFLGAVLHHSTARSTIGTRIASLRWKPGYSGRPPPGPPHISWWLGEFTFGHQFLLEHMRTNSNLKWDEIDISQRRKHWTFILQDRPRDIWSVNILYIIKNKWMDWKQGRAKHFETWTWGIPTKASLQKKWISSHRAPITVPQAQSPVLSAEQEVSIVSKAIFAIIAFKLAIAWSASFVSYPARLDPACWGLRVGMKRLDPVHGLAVEEEFLNMESMKTLRSKTLRKPLHILKSNANQPIEKMKEKTGGRKRLQPSMKTVAWPCPDSFFSTLVQIPDPGHILVSSSCSRIPEKPVKFKIWLLEPVHDYILHIISIVTTHYNNSWSLLFVLKL